MTSAKTLVPGHLSESVSGLEFWGGGGWGRHDPTHDAPLMLVLPWLSCLSLGLPEPLPDPVTKASIRGNAEPLGTLLCLWAGLAGVTGPVCSTILTSNQYRQCREEQGRAASTKEASDLGGGGWQLARML